MYMHYGRVGAIPIHRQFTDCLIGRLPVYLHLSFFTCTSDYSFNFVSFLFCIATGSSTG